MKVIKEITSTGTVNAYDLEDDNKDVLMGIYRGLIWFLLKYKDNEDFEGKDELRQIYNLLSSNKKLFENSRVDSEEAFTEALYSLVDGFGPISSLRIGLLKACRNFISTGGMRI